MLCFQRHKNQYSKNNYRSFTSYKNGLFTNDYKIGARLPNFYGIIIRKLDSIRQF